MKALFIHPEGRESYWNDLAGMQKDLQSLEDEFTPDVLLTAEDVAPIAKAQDLARALGDVKVPPRVLLLVNGTNEGPGEIKGNISVLSCQSGSARQVSIVPKKVRAGHDFPFGILNPADGLWYVPRGNVPSEGFEKMPLHEPGVREYCPPGYSLFTPPLADADFSKRSAKIWLPICDDKEISPDYFDLCLYSSSGGVPIPPYAFRKNPQAVALRADRGFCSVQTRGSFFSAYDPAKDEPQFALCWTDYVCLKRTAVREGVTLFDIADEIPNRLV
ncbi:MAG: hypothetical protein V1820_05435 [archaeon]